MQNTDKITTIISNIEKQIEALIAIKKDVESLLGTAASETKETTAVTLEEVRGVLAEKSRDGLTKQVKSLIQSFGVNRLSDVSESDYDALLKKAKELTHE